MVINDLPGYRIDHMPFGGVKESGQGREGLRWAMEDMTELRLMVAQPGMQRPHGKPQQPLFHRSRWRAMFRCRL